MAVNKAHKEIDTELSIDANDWWRGGVIYQIYPRSFQDSNGDGIGDLPGILQRLPYIASLGVSAIWISPFFTSPMEDFGYDVSDYCDVDDLFGTLQDFDAIVKEAHQLGIRVIIDLVLSHTSSQHPWFIESRRDRQNPRADWYVWANPKPDGTPPNNWLSIFGGSAWHWEGRREQYYLHNFLTSQPDLNFHHTDVQDELLKVTQFWLERGVDGFRLDTVNFYFADKQLRDNPALPLEERNDSIAPMVNPYNHQSHLYSKNQPENIEFLQRFRVLLDQYPATTSVGEIGDAQRGLELLGEYTSGEDRLHMSYAFDFLAKEPLSAHRLESIFAKFDAVASDGWPCWAFTNHDIERHVTRWKLNPAAQRLYTTLMMCLKGTPCIYQGEELGLPEVDIEFNELQDPYGIEFWPEFKGRDGCRTPMVWETSNQNAGFSTGETWLPIPSQHLGFNVESQQNDGESLLQHYRRAIAFRQSYSSLMKGEQTTLHASGNVATFTRSFNSESIFCAFNLGGQTAKVTLPAGSWTQIGSDIGSVVVTSDPELLLGAWQSCIAMKESTER